MQVLTDTFGSKCKVRACQASTEISYLNVGGETLCMPSNTILQTSQKPAGSVLRTDSQQTWHPNMWNNPENLIQSGFPLICMNSSKLCWSMGCLVASPEQVKSRTRGLCIFVSRWSDDNMSSPAQWAVSCICCVHDMPPWRQCRSRAPTEVSLGSHCVSFDVHGRKKAEVGDSLCKYM